jgi:Probable zinc-ribbon domain
MAKKNRRKARYVREWEEREAAATLAARRENGAPVDPARIPPYPDVLRASDGSYRDFFEDIEFRCQDCGAEQVWTAADQKWWFEVAGGSLYSRAVRCAACRAARR